MTETACQPLTRRPTRRPAKPAPENFGVPTIASDLGQTHDLAFRQVREMRLEGLKKVSWIGNYVVMHFRDGLIWQPISQEALEGFPVKSIQKHAKNSETLPATFTASSRKFSRLITHLDYYLQSMRRQDWVVRVKGEA